jgi:hypothetical protein
MGLFDFFKPKQSDLSIKLQQMINDFFPKGEKDIQAGTDELLFILDNRISQSEARNILIKSVALSRISEQQFNKERLKTHLAGYCIQYFNDKQIEKFHGYLGALTVAMKIHGSTPSEVKRNGNGYFW